MTRNRCPGSGTNNAYSNGAEWDARQTGSRRMGLVRCPECSYTGQGFIVSTDHGVRLSHEVIRVPNHNRRDGPRSTRF